jgi:2-polyprenyl-6-methoxyphenol hydroxylase-like FAD-dependent oxidoreductase
VAGTSECDVLVVGGGIAGLTAAIALKRVGIRVQIIERATAMTQAGTALSLWPNALAALAQLELSSAIAEIGAEEPAGTVRDWTGRVVVTIDQSRLYRHLGTPTLVVQRGELQQVLLHAASDIPIMMRSTVSRVTSSGNEGVVEMSNGDEYRTPLVLGCDGIRSVARAGMDNPQPRFTGRTSWRAVLDGASHLASGACLTAGQGKQFIASRLRGGLVYWAADVALPEGANEAMVDKKAFLLRTFAGWHDPIPELIERTDEEQLVLADLYDSVPKHLFHGRVVLLGDAAHPMTPDLGQGACQGIEDGVVLAACLATNSSIEAALSDFEAARLGRVRMMVRESRRLGMIATAESEFVSKIRNGLVAHMPDRLNRMMVARYASEASFLRILRQVASAS